MIHYISRLWLVLPNKASTSTVNQPLRLQIDHPIILWMKLNLLGKEAYGDAHLIQYYDKTPIIYLTCTMMTKHTLVVGSFVQGTPTTIAYTFSANYLGLQILECNMIWVVRTSRKNIQSFLMPPGENSEIGDLKLISYVV